MYKEILFKDDARKKILEGVRIAGDAVASTLGPRGQNVIFEESIYPTVTKDGVTVIQQILLSDKFKNLGVMIAREAAENTNREAGDGTTTTVVLLRAILEGGHKAVASGMNPILVKRGMDIALEHVLKALDAQAKNITSEQEKLQVATISANNDAVIGKLIAGVLKKVGLHGTITVTNANTFDLSVDYTKGTKLNEGYLSHVYINDPKRLAAVINEPRVIICTDDISMQAQLVPIIQSLISNNERNILLLANSIGGQALAFLVQNFLQGKFNCVPVKLPSFGGYQRDLVYDLAALTGASVLGREDALKIEEATAADCGGCRQVIAMRDSTVIIGADGKVDDRILEVKALLAEEEDIFKKDKLKLRLGRLTGSIANIKVGGPSETEQNEIKYRIEDALNATKSACEEGIVSGGGVALLKSIASLDKIRGKQGNIEANEGIEIVAKALSKPLQQIADNGGVSGEVVVDKVLRQSLGYNALTNKYEDLLKAGIIDPKKVVRHCIINAVATAGVLLTNNCAIITKQEK